VVPFWADHNSLPAEKIAYEIFNTTSETLSVVSRFIRQQTGTHFEGSWMLMANWDFVPEYQSDADKVSIALPPKSLGDSFTDCLRLRYQVIILL